MLGTLVWHAALAVVTVACLGALPLAAAAEPASGSSATGQKLAEKYCADCHVVALTPKPAWNDPLPFQVIANRPETTAAFLIGHIRKEHAHTPTNARPAAEADDIAAYILSLRKS